MGKCSKRRAMTGKWAPGGGRNMYTIGAEMGRGTGECCDSKKNIENIKRIQDNFVTPFCNKQYHLIGNIFNEIELLENDRKHACTGGVLTDFMQNTISAADLASTLDFYYKLCQKENADQEKLICELYEEINQLKNKLPVKDGKYSSIVIK